MSRNYRSDRNYNAPGGGSGGAAPRGDRPQGGASGGGRGAAGGGRRFRRRKLCRMCADKVDSIDYKDVKMLQGHVPERGKIMPRRISGNCAIHQRMLAESIKRARTIALLPFATD